MFFSSSRGQSKILHYTYTTKYLVHFFIPLKFFFESQKRRRNIIPALLSLRSAASVVAPDGLPRVVAMMAAGSSPQLGNPKEGLSFP